MNNDPAQDLKAALDKDLERVKASLEASRASVEIQKATDRWMSVFLFASHVAVAVIAVFLFGWLAGVGAFFALLFVLLLWQQR